jgi:photosystem II stability/assembly factor-like uncharacterized protein
MTTYFVRWGIRVTAIALAIVAMNAAADSASLAPIDLKALEWRLVGPFQGGRSSAVAGVPGEPLTYYFGGSDGGVWKTTDAGHRWRNVSDCCITTGAIGALAVAPSDTKIIYAGTGESFPRGDVAPGNGVWKSTDAGVTWTHSGLTETRMISAIVVDPKDASHVYVAALGDVFIENAHRGVYESHDGGASWRRILASDRRSGAADLVIDAHDPRVMYAALWSVQRRPWSLTSGGPGSGLYKTVDGGAHWTNLSRAPGLPAGTLGKIGVAVSASDPSRVYALVHAKDGGLFRSDDAGAHWTRVNDAALIRQRAWYFTKVYVDAKNPDRLIMPQANGLLVSTDAGKTFTIMRPEGGDNHVMWIAPDDTRRMIVGNDQGATITLDGGASWSQNQNQPTAAFYHVAVDDEVPFNLYGAQQERATLRVPSRNVSGWAIERENWGTVAQWESGHVLPVPGQSWITYATGGFGGLIQRHDRRSGERQIIGPWPDAHTGRPASDLKHRFQWVFPLVISHAAPDTLYTASQHVWRTRDAGATWAMISPDLSRNDKTKQRPTGGPITLDGTSVEVYGTVFALAQSPLHATQLWAGTDDGKVWLTRDDGATWRDVTPRALPAFAVVSSIDASRLDAGTAYVAARREREGDYAPYLFATHDFGATWRRIDAGLPRDDSSFVLRTDTVTKGLLFAGTLRGVHVSFDDGAHWLSLQNNLPHSAVHDLVIVPQQDAIALATHGRSFWVLDTIQPLREIAQHDATAPAQLYTPQTVFLLGGYGSPGSAEFGAGENPAAGGRIVYNLSRDATPDQPVTLTITDADDRVVAQFTSAPKPRAVDPDAIVDPDAEPVEAGEDTGALPAKTGMNAYVWDLDVQLPAAAGSDEPCNGPTVMPGTYRATLARGEWRRTREFNVSLPPTSTASADDLAARYALHARIATKLCEIAAAKPRVRALRERYETVIADANASRREKSDARASLARVGAIHDALYDHQSDAYLDSIAHPAKLNGRLGSLGWAAGGTLRRPGDTMAVFADELFVLVDAQLAALRAIDTPSQR